MRLSRLRSSFLLGVLFTSVSWAQSFGFGAKLGVPFTDVFNGISDDTRFTVGPMVEFRLPIISFEADALFHDVNIRPPANGFPNLTVSSGSTWQFPIVGKVKLPTTPILKPYGEAGVAFRAFTSGGSDVDAASKKGFVLGAGLDIHAIIVHITPELRYTHWGSGNAVSLQANQNQFEFLVGISR